MIVMLHEILVKKLEIDNLFKIYVGRDCKYIENLRLRKSQFVVLFSRRSAQEFPQRPSSHFDVL